MNLKDDDVVSAVALVIDSGEEDAEVLQEGLPLDGALLPPGPADAAEPETTEPDA